MDKQIIWSISDPLNPKAASVNSVFIRYLGYIDGLISWMDRFKLLPKLIRSVVPSSVFCDQSSSIIGGNIYELANKGLFRFILDKVNEFPNESLINFRMVHVPMTLVTDGKLSKKILMSPNVGRGIAYDRLTEFFGYGIFTSKIHQRWSHQRSLILRVLTYKTLLEVAPDLSEIMFNVLDEMISSNPEIELVTTLSQMTLVAFCQVIFGVDVTDTAFDIINPLNNLLVYINGALEPFALPFDPSYKKFIKDRDFVHEWMRDLIRKAKCSKSCNPAILKELNRENATEMEHVEFVMSIVLGGHETTARLILGTMYSIYYNPVCQMRLNKETQEYKSINSKYGYDISNQPYLQKVIKEGTRLYPPVWILAREPNQDIVLDEFTFKKGTQILISPLLFLRSERVWGPDAEIFNPDRFDNLPDDAKEIFIPFIVGQENCPGKRFAELEASLLISRFFLDYDIELLPHKINPSSAGTFRLTDRLPARIYRKY